MSLEEAALPVSSSAEPELHADQERLYRDVLRLLVEHRVPHAVSGAFALHEHTGVRRPAKDLDIFVTSETASLALELLSSYDFRCELCRPHRDRFVDCAVAAGNHLGRTNQNPRRRGTVSLQDVRGAPRKVRWRRYCPHNLCHQRAGRLEPDPRVSRRSLGNTALEPGFVSIYLPSPKSLRTTPRLDAAGEPAHAQDLESRSQSSLPREPGGRKYVRD